MYGHMWTMFINDKSYICTFINHSNSLMLLALNISHDMIGRKYRLIYIIEVQGNKHLTQYSVVIIPRDARRRNYLCYTMD